MRSRLILLTLAAVLMLPAGGFAVGDNSAGTASETKSAGSGHATTTGVVKKVDKAAGKVTISHEPVESLGMPKMTMVFRVKDPAMLDRLKPDDRITFAFDKANGEYTVTSIEPAK